MTDGRNERVYQIARLTLILILLYPGDPWFHRIYMRGLAVWGLAMPRIGVSSWLWWTLFALNIIVQNIYNWAAADNHTWLMSYWYLAMALSLGAQDVERCISVNARLLLGSVFLIATIQKELSADYLNGQAFQHLLTTDWRFFEVASVIGGYLQEPGSLAEAMNQLQPLIIVPVTSQMRTLALVLTWWTIIIEALIAGAFLCEWVIKAPPVVLGNARNGLLLLFVATTYCLAPVVGFGGVILLLGLAQCSPDSRRTRVLYLAAFIAMTFFAIAGPVRARLLRSVWGHPVFF